MGDEGVAEWWNVKGGSEVVAAVAVLTSGVLFSITLPQNK
jgi:hypothetical protein